ncbi:MAG: histidine phosphotransferase [Rubellimicrobium sp.]|nr:histidine phosphotransferase [Rubellimicrobium sp.]
MTDQPDLGALIASRICHDLVGPLGAIGNGVELLSLTGAAGDGDEMALIQQSVADAAARLRFFRLAYGAATPGQTVARADILQVLAAVSRAGRVSFLWSADGDQPRDEVRAVFLALQCLETALPLGGEVRITRLADGWRMVADSARLQVDAGLWAGLAGGSAAPDVAPERVQFALLPRVLMALGRTLAVETGAGEVALRF